MKEMKITDEMIKSLEDAVTKENDFFARHGFPDYVGADNKTGMASEPHKAWVMV